jgi:hypothetical protein
VKPPPVKVERDIIKPVEKQQLKDPLEEPEAPATGPGAAQPPSAGKKPDAGGDKKPDAGKKK